MTGKMSATDQRRIARKTACTFECTFDAGSRQRCAHALGALVPTSTQCRQMGTQGRIGRIETQADNVNGFSGKGG